MHSYLAKHEDIIIDQAMSYANIMCFTKTFLRHQQEFEDDYLLMRGNSIGFRLVCIQTSTEDLAKGGIMIVCPHSLKPIRINIHHPNNLQVVSITATSTHSGCRICIVAVYKCPQQQLSSFLPLLEDYIISLPQIMPTIIPGEKTCCQDQVHPDCSSLWHPEDSLSRFNYPLQTPGHCWTTSTIMAPLCRCGRHILFRP